MSAPVAPLETAPEAEDSGVEIERRVTLKHTYSLMKISKAGGASPRSMLSGGPLSPVGPNRGFDGNTHGDAGDLVMVKRRRNCISDTRNYISRIMSNFWMEIFMMVVTVLYAALVLFDMLISDDMRDDLEQELFVLDLVFLSILLLELLLKLFAYGANYCRDGWNVFDGMVVIASLVMGLLVKVFSSVVLLRLLRLRSIVRLFRLVVVMRRVKQANKTIKALKAVAFATPQTPLERVMDALKEIQAEAALSPDQFDKLGEILDLLSTENLYKPVEVMPALNEGGEVDTEMTDWLRSHYVAPANRQVAHRTAAKRAEYDSDENTIIEEGDEEDEDGDGASEGALGAAGPSSDKGGASPSKGGSTPTGKASGLSNLETRRHSGSSESRTPHARTPRGPGRRGSNSRGSGTRASRRSESKEVPMSPHGSSKRSDRYVDGPTEDLARRKSNLYKQRVKSIVAEKLDLGSRFFDEEAEPVSEVETKAEPRPVSNRSEGSDAAPKVHSIDVVNIDADSKSFAPPHRSARAGGRGSVHDGTPKHARSARASLVTPRHRRGQSTRHMLNRVTEKLEKVVLSVAEEAKLRVELEKLDRWDFDIFEVEKCSHGRPLPVVLQTLLEAHGLIASLGMDEAVVRRCIRRIEAGYIKTNLYHNAMHAADVVQSTSFFISKPFLLPYLSNIEKFGALVAAAVHDFQHPGVNNAFLVATTDALAITYNDASPLENMHVASFFELLRDDRYNMASDFDRDTYARFRQLVIQLVLGTDMVKHFEDIAKLKSRIQGAQREAADLISRGEASGAETVSLLRGLTLKNGRGLVIQTQTDSELFLRVALHTADVSNPAKPLKVALQWTRRVVEEFFQQGDKELASGLPTSAFFDRRKPNIPKHQLGFINFIVAPLFEQWSYVIEEASSDCQRCLDTNRAHWEGASAAGIFGMTCLDLSFTPTALPTAPVVEEVKVTVSDGR